MMTVSDVKQGMLDKMKTIFPEPEYTYYAMDVVENFERPCFFTQIKPVDNKAANYNSRRIQAILYIDYMQERIDEAGFLDVIQKLQDAFGLAVRIGERAVHVTDIGWEYIGTGKNTAEIAVELEWGARIEHERKLPVMESARINTEMEELSNGNA